MHIKKEDCPNPFLVSRYPCARVHFSTLPRKPRLGPSPTRVEQPVLDHASHVVPLRVIDHRIESLSPEDHLRDLIRAQLVSQCIHSETRAAISPVCTEFVK